MDNSIKCSDQSAARLRAAWIALIVCVMDRLDHEIAEQRVSLEEAAAEVRKLAEQLKVAKERHELARARLEALEFAASVRPASFSGRRRVSSGDEAGGRRGRQPGAITEKSRAFLEAVHSLGGPASYEQIERVVSELAGLELGMAQIRDKVRRLADSGYLRGSREEGFELTDDGISKIGQSRNEEDPAGGISAGGAVPSSGGNNPFRHLAAEP